jgi:hypothetical protein
MKQVRMSELKLYWKMPWVLFVGFFQLTIN